MKTGRVLIIIGTVLCVLQVLSFIGNGLAPLQFAFFMLRISPSYGIGMLLGQLWAAIVGTILLIIGIRKRSKTDPYYGKSKVFDSNTDVICPSCKSLMPKERTQCSECGGKLQF
jgi:uncharacterized membrane protein